LRERKITVRLLVGLIVVVLVEGICYLAGSWIAYRDRFIQREPRSVGSTTYDEYLAVRDDLLGWPRKEAFGGPEFDRSGSRPNPEFPDPSVHKSCISLYGDSFTLGEEVDDQRAWGNQLSRLVGCRVANFGIGGYGTDQAYLRFKKIEDPSQVVVLGYLSSNIVRNITRLRDLYSGKIEYALKPRFVLTGSGELSLVPIPDLSEEEYLRAMGVVEPHLALEHESFQPGGPLAVQEFRFPFSVSLLRALPGILRRGLSRRPHYAALYGHGHPTLALETTAAIMGAFWRDALAAGKQPAIVIFATAEELAYQQRTAQASYQSLLKILDESEITYLDLGPLLLRHLGSRSVLEIFKSGGHYDEEVNELVAANVYQHLRDRGIEPRHSDGVSRRNGVAR
jgi:hypothetical protein